MSAAPLPAFGEESLPAAPPPTQATLLGQAQLAAIQIAPALTGAATGQTATPAPTSTDRSRWAFFKSPAGIAVLATLGVGVGYALYSTQNDRITSPGK